MYLCLWYKSMQMMYISIFYQFTELSLIISDVSSDTLIFSKTFWISILIKKDNIEHSKTF